MSSIIVSTSGTSGTPKKIELTDEIMSARISTIATAKGIHISDCKAINVAWDKDSSSAVRFAEWGKQTGKKIIGIIPVNQIVETFIKEKVDCIFGAPAYLVRVAQLFQATGKSAGLLQIVTGHMAISDKDVAFIKKWLCKNIQVNYGCSEIGTIASATVEQIEDIDGCVGFILPNVQVEIVNGGYIRIKSPTTMVTEYVDDPENTAKYFIDGWFYPGDAGYFTKDGRLVITKNR